MAAAAAAAAEGDEEKGWKEALKKMLPAGAPVPDHDHLDYSIALEYVGPPVDFEVPKIQPLDPESLPREVPRFNRLRSADSLSLSGSARSFSALAQAAATSVAEQEDVVSPSVSSASRDRSYSPTRDGGGVRRATVVTFNMEEEEEEEEEGEGEGSQITDSEISHSMPSPVPFFQRQRYRKNGACGRCKKVNLLVHRESCLVCGERYCSSCLLKAMGSMPEGRKCVSCIGRPIGESKRSRLGKASRMLCKVCSPLEVKQIMKAEKECQANQLRPEQLIVNGRRLRQEELDELLGCPNPPQKLKPGRYWYDKDSGLWGKEGEKPDRFVTSKLNVGGALQSNASNGRTGVTFNGREITKAELRVLKLAKVQCPRDTAFWLYDDGSIEEEGQNNIKGNIWRKASTRLICTLLSLPKPPPTLPPLKEGSANISNKSTPDYLDQKRVQKLLLFGHEGSGTSTIFKQARFLYGKKYNPIELQDIKLMIQSNMYKYLGTLLEARERFEEEFLEAMKNHPNDAKISESGENGGDSTSPCIYSINQRLKHFSDWLLEITAMGDLETFFPAATREYAPVVEEVWKDPAVQEAYKRRNEFHSPDVAKYFLDRAVDISSNEYEPTERDILYAEGIDQCNGLACLEFSLNDRSPMSESFTEHVDNPPHTKYQLIRVNSKGLSEGCKWLEMFEDVRAVIFCVSLSDYDQFRSSGSGTVHNKMLASRELLESLVKHPSFRNTPFILLLNKYDAFEEKINKTPLTVCEWFGDFSPVKPNNTSQSLASHAYFYVAAKFKDLYKSISYEKLFVCQTNARERITVDEAFKYVREVLKWEETKENVYAFGDESFYSTDLSSSPYIRQE